MELLAVIAILAILVVLAIPGIVKLFEEAKINTIKIETQNIIKAANQGYSLQLLKDSVEGTTYTFINGEETKTGNIPLNISGKKIMNGIIEITAEGQVRVAIVNDKYCVRKEYDTDELTITEDTKDCN